MNKYKLSKRSLDNLVGVDKRLVQVMEAAIKVTPVDFGISEGLRSIERQTELVNTGKSRTMNSKHLTGKAVDIFIASKTHAYDINHLSLVAGVIFACAHVLNIRIRWGGDWNMNGIIIVDQDFDDLVHFELID